MGDNDLLSTFSKALIKAKEGMESTKDMISLSSLLTKIARKE